MVSDYETTQKRRNIIVGVFVLVAMCAFVVMIYKFGFQTAPGVQKDTPIRFCGYQIGKVTKVMAPQIRRDLNSGLEYHQTLVVLSIDKKYVNIPYNSEVKLMTRGLGSSYIEIKAPLPDPNKPVTKFLENASLLQGATGMTSEFFPEESQKKLEELVDNLGALIKNANDILGDKENRRNIKTALANLSDASKQATQALNEFQEFFAAGIHTSEELSKAVAELRVILGQINNGQGTVAMLVNDGRLYENLLENLKFLLFGTVLSNSCGPFQESLNSFRSKVTVKR
jgi:ABC-type transporter Mla subunit MlaD